MEAKLTKRNVAGRIRYGLALLVAVVMLFAMQMFAHATEGDTVTVKSGKTDVKVRASAVNGSEVAKVNGGDTFTIVSTTEGSDGYTWYQISGEVNGTAIDGYIRSDFVDVTAAAAAPEEGGEAAPEEGGEAAPEEGGEAPAETGTDTTQVVSGSIVPMDPPAGEDGASEKPVLPEGFSEVKIRINGREVSAWTNETFFIFYASSPEGNTGWYLYDGTEGRWIRYTDFLLNTGSAQASEVKGEGVSVTIVIVMGVVIAILVIACGFLGFKAFGSKNDDDDDDDDYDDDDDDDDDEEEDYRPVKKQPAARTQTRPAPQGGQGQPVRRAPQGGQGQPVRRAPQGGQGQPVRRAPQGGQGQPVRRAPQGGAPVTRRSPQGGAQRPQQRQSRPIVDDDEE